MKNALKDMLEAMRTPRHPHYTSLLDFPLIDASALSTRLDLEQSGRQRGELGEPDGASQGFDNVEQRIVTEIDSAKTRAHGKFLDHAQTLAQRLANLDLRLFVTRVKEAALATQGDFKTAVRQGVDDLYLARKHLVESDEELRTFRERHRLRRPARSPDSRIFTVGVVIAVFSLEAYLNGSFLGEAHAFGLLGGYVEAAAVAFINVFTAFFVGWAWLGFLIHRRITLQFIAVVFFMAYVALVFTLNLGFAHYRDLLVNTMSDTAARAALERLLADPLGVVDIKSWYLFILGIVFWIFALYEGRRMDDPYPGYGPLHRRHVQAVHRYNDVKRDAYEELQELREDNAKAMERAKHELDARRAERMAINESRHRLTNGFEQHLQHLEQLGNELMSVYREANIQVRRQAGHGAGPRRFSEHWTMSKPQIATPPEIDPREQDELVRTGVAELDRLIAQTHEQYEAAIQQFQTIDQLMSLEEFGRGAPAQP